MRLTWSDVIVGFGDNVDISANDQDGMYTVTINGERVLYATRSEAMVVFIGLSRMFGKSASRQLMKLKPTKSVKEKLIRY